MRAHVAPLGGKQEESGGGRIVVGDTSPVPVHEPEIVVGVRVAPLGGDAVPAQGR